MPRYYEWWVYVVLASPGIALFVVNWAIFFHNLREEKWVSGIVLFGGLWIAGVCLLSPWKWLALIGLADPGIWQLIYALFCEYFWDPVKKNRQEGQDHAEE